MPEITLEDGRKIKVSRLDRDGRIEITLSIEEGEACLLHWGLASGVRATWKMPPVGSWPKESRPSGETAIQSPLLMQDDERGTVIGIERDALKELGLNVISFVIYYPDRGRWDNNRGKNYSIRLLEEEPPGLPATGLSSLMAGIVEAETGDHSWSLMHRFNLCHDLLEGADVEGAALIYVWMRFSAIRQLTWQRRYNTKPRELSHAQDRLTLRLASIYRERPELREITRLLFGTVSRGGEGQRVRDEILNIMHRHRLKEVAGTFLEEWHQKLHNNTTPDDIVICEAYLAFLRSNGDLGVFYRTLQEGGVTRMRLKGFERAIVSDPDFIPFLKDALIGDFQYYLGVLRSVHSATDLDTAFGAGRHLLDSGTAEAVASILQNKEGPAVELARRITHARASLLGKLQDGVRELLYLDLALEEFLRVVVERKIGEHTEPELFELTGLVLENMLFSYRDVEFSESLADLGALGKMAPYTPDWALRARAVFERLMRALGGFADRHYQVFQPKAEVLGKSFKAESWTISLFSEELIRGMPVFVLSMLLRRLDPLLRKRAQIGKWQVINPGEAKGRVEVVDELRSIQGKSFTAPTVIVAESVRGDEEPPAGVCAIITPDAVDLVAHVAVRTRQARLLFATCYDEESLDALKSLREHFVSIAVSPAGDVEYEKIDEDEKGVRDPLAEKIRYLRIERPRFVSYAIAPKDYREGLVGGKSYNLKLLEGLLPAHLPVSVTIPFGVFEHVLEHNPETAGRYGEAAKRIEEKDNLSLDELKKAVLSLGAPEDMMPALRRVMTDAGLPWPEDLPTWAAIWSCIKRVWASKWNERAYLSRKRWGFPHEELYMAVLIQEVIKSDYAFVIHTVNPVSGDRGELYAEVVPGLGETIVGNYPGRALGFSARKDRPTEPAILSYPSKSTALFLEGGGLIFRSDANAEDLPGYAGAGLYDSVMLPEPEEVALRYSEEPLLWDEGFRNRLLTSIVEAGAAVERATGSPQDIEGVYSQGKLFVVQTRPQMGL